MSVRFSSECEALEEMHKMGSKCANGDFVYDEELEKQYMHDDKVIRIIARIPILPDALVILYANDDQVEISNIIPYNKSVDTIERDVYNKIVDELNEVVTDTIIRYETEVALLEYYDLHVISKYDY